MGEAVDGISLSVKGRTLGLVGESGSGKSTTGIVALGSASPSGGRIFEGEPLEELLEETSAFQEAGSDSLSKSSPRSTRVRPSKISSRGMKLHGLVESDRELDERVAALFSEVGLKEEHLSRYPHEFRRSEAAHSHCSSPRPESRVYRPGRAHERSTYRCRLRY